MNLRDCNPGDVLHVGEGPDARRVVVVQQRPDGVEVIWHWNGVFHGPRVLPHAAVYQRLYEDEAIEKRESFYDYHPDMKP